MDKIRKRKEAITSRSLAGSSLEQIMVWILLKVRTVINVPGKKLLQSSANATWFGTGRAPCTPKIRKKQQEEFVSHQLPAPTCELALGKKIRKPVPKTQGHVRVKSLKPYICSDVHKRLHVNESVRK